MRSLVSRLTGLFKAGAFLTAMFSVATAFDSLHQYLELFSHFKLQYLAVSLLLMIFFILARDRRYFLLMTAAACLNAWFVLPWYLPDSDTPRSSQTFTVLLANVMKSNGEHGKLSALLSKEQPDFVFLQEVNPGWAQHVDQLPDYPHRQVVPENGAFGIAVLSRVPLTDVRVIQSPPFGFPTIVASAAVNGRDIIFTTTHPIPPIGGHNYDGRNEQLRSVANIVNGQSGARVLIGDLNTTMWGANYRWLISATGLRNARSGFGVLPTWPTHIPIAYIPIDHCLVSPELDVIDIRTGPDIGSDHLPLITTLSVK